MLLAANPALPLSQTLLYTEAVTGLASAEIETSTRSQAGIDGRRSPRLRLTQTATLVSAGLIAFVLPFYSLSPGAEPVYSVAYTAGASNRPAVVGLALVCLLITVLTLRWLPPLRLSIQADQPLRRMWLYASILLITAYTSIILALASHAQIDFGDSAYFLERLRDMADGNLHLYRDLEFAYGPLLLYPTLWLHQLAHLPLSAAYAITLALFNAAGLGCCFYLLNQLPISRGWRSLGFAIATLAQFNPFLGPNYSFVKFALPFALLWWAAHRRTPARAALALAAGTFVVLTISPELGVGLSAGILTFGVIRVLFQRPRQYGWLLALASPPVAYAAFIAIAGSGFLQRLGQAAKGALNLIIEPMPAVLILLFALVWLAPRAIGSRLREGHGDGPVLAGLLVVALGLLPGALGRADTLHIFFNGFGFLLLATLAFENLTTPGAKLWGAALTFVAVSLLAGTLNAYAGAFAQLRAGLQQPAVSPIDIEHLRQDVGTNRVATPFGVDLAIDQQLRAAHLYQPDFYPGIGEIWDLAGERRKIAALRRSTFALVPGETAPLSEPLPNRPSHMLLRLGYRYRQRRTPFQLGAAIQSELNQHWRVIDRLGGWSLYQQRQADLPGIGEGALTRKSH